MTRPLILPNEMVKAVLDGRKTQHRVPAKVAKRFAHLSPDLANARQHTIHTPRGLEMMLIVPTTGIDTLVLRCPLGVVGERLWVRETHRFEMRDGEYGTRYKAGQNFRPCTQSLQRACVAAAISGSPLGISKWSNALPQWASRLTLEVTRVRVEKIQSIGDDDIQAEGRGVANHYMLESQARMNKSCRLRRAMQYRDGVNPNDSKVCARADFAVLWDGAHGNGSWATNPWCWALTFKIATA